MRTKFAIGFAAIISTFAADATAGIITISFDGLASGESVLEYYNGGLGGNGSGPGPALGVSFSSDWIAGAPDVYLVPGGKSVAFTGTATINFHQGWSGMTSFYYAGNDLTVSFYEGENGLGNLVANLGPLGPSQVSCFSIFCPTGRDVGPFHSAVFVSSGVRIDALTNGAQVIPEPAGLTLTILGLAILGLAAGRSAGCGTSHKG